MSILLPQHTHTMSYICVFTHVTFTTEKTSKGLHVPEGVQKVEVSS